jgi:diaminopimelate decarboxylase
MSDNARTALYGAQFSARLASRAGVGSPQLSRVVGKHCESGDILVRDAQVPADLVVGDVLVTPVTGAYGHSMGSNYNQVPRPAVVFVADGSARVVVRRESLDDLLRNDVP